MSDNRKITNAIEIKDNSAKRIAFDLTIKIGSAESQANNGYLTDEQKTSAYWLKLYSQCSRVVDYNHINIDELINE